MKNNTIKKKIISDFNADLNKCDIPEHYETVRNNLSKGGVTFVAGKTKRRGIFAFTYTAITILLCALIGLTGFFIGQERNRREIINDRIKGFMEEYTDNYYDRPVSVFYFSKYNEIQIYVGSTVKDNKPQISYFYYINLYVFDGDIQFVNKTKDISISIAIGDCAGNLSELLSISDNDEVEIRIITGVSAYMHCFICYDEIYGKLLK